MSRLTAVVTGASRGIGRAIVARLLADGYAVVGIGRSGGALEDARRSFGVHGVRFRPYVADVRDPNAIADALLEAGPLHAVVANAGIVRQARLDAADALAVWRDVLATNLDGVFNTLSVATPSLVEGGRVVAISSGLGKLGRAAFGAYAASKHGVLGLVKCVAKELALRRITANAVCPGWVDTEMARADVARFAADQGRAISDVEAEILRGIPSGKFVAPEQVAALVVWLLSDEASAVTGEAFNISGGEFFA